MKIRTVYFKVADLNLAKQFWSALLQIQPHKDTPTWAEFMCENIRLGLLLNTFGDVYAGANFVPVFEHPDAELDSAIKRARAAGAEIILDGLNDPNLLSVVMKAPDGHEFELSKFHD